MNHAIRHQIGDSQDRAFRELTEEREADDPVANSTDPFRTSVSSLQPKELDCDQNRCDRWLSEARSCVVSYQRAGVQLIVERTSAMVPRVSPERQARMSALAQGVRVIATSRADATPIMQTTGCRLGIAK